MPVIKSDPGAETVGVSPKPAWISIAALALGIVLAVLDKLVLGDDVPDAVWLTLIGVSPGALAVGYGAPAALQKPKLPVSEHASTTVPDPKKPTW